MSCFSPFLLEEGSSACIERPPCTSKDFFQIHTPCDKEGKVSRRHDWPYRYLCIWKQGSFFLGISFPITFQILLPALNLSEALGLSFACRLCSFYPSVRICQIWVCLRDVLWWDDKFLALVMGLMGSLVLLPYFHTGWSTGWSTVPAETHLFSC